MLVIADFSTNDGFFAEQDVLVGKSSFKLLCLAWNVN